MHEWISACGHTPHVIVDATSPGAEVPRAYVKDGKIVLNLSMAATQRLKLGDADIELDARFNGISQHVRFPVSAVLGIFARETGEGMAFTEQDMAGSSPATAPGESPPEPTPPEGGGGRRPQLRVVK
jgi:stringent starvation protein B